MFQLVNPNFQLDVLEFLKFGLFLRWGFGPRTVQAFRAAALNAVALAALGSKHKKSGGFWTFSSL